MSALGKFLRKQEGGRIAFWCPGCNESHAVPIEGAGAWGFNGNADAPTITPSIAIHWTELTPEGEAMIQRARETGEYHGEGFKYPSVEKCCHSNITDGRIQFHGDCTHALVGQTVPLPEVPQ